MSKEAWLAANAELEAIEAERAALLAPTNARYEAAQEKIDKIEEESGEHVGVCEGCLTHLWAGDRYSYDSVNGMRFCEACTPSYEDMLADPTSFYDADEEYMTAETAKACVEAHVAAGGKVTDKVGILTA